MAEKSELQITLEQIQDEKNKKLLPENLKKGVTCLGVEGSIDLENLIPENIKEGIIINGVIGTYKGETIE